MLLLVMLCSLCFAASDSAAEMVKLKGSGASFPFPLYGRWFKIAAKSTNKCKLTTRPRSGAGIKDFVNKTVDFAASDAAMTDEEIASVDMGVTVAHDGWYDRARLQPPQRPERIKTVA
jgi:phosphate transport system substrate-binding protein